jgi:hypothetical protein
VTRVSNVLTVPNRIFVGVVGLLLLGMGLYGVTTGRVPARVGTIKRDDRALLFWIHVLLYAGLGIVALCLAWTQYL